jgi:hypothetical protein
MAEERKNYWIKIFIKKCTSLHTAQEQLDAYFEWCEHTYNVSEQYSNQLKTIFTIDEYINRLIPVVDKYFSIDELKEMIRFYSTDTGKKLLDLSFLQNIGKASMDLNTEIEQKFSTGNNKL